MPSQYLLEAGGTGDVKSKNEQNGVDPLDWPIWVDDEVFSLLTVAQCLSLMLALELFMQMALPRR